VIHATGITTIDDLGGIYRRMPITGLTFFIGSIAITGLPPLNGFISEWLIYLGALRGAMALHPLGSVFAIVVLPALALIGGLAVACFIKAFGIIFQGEPRSEAAAAAHESNFSMQLAMLIGAAICIGLGVWGSGALRLITPAVQVVTKINAFSTNTSDSLDAITRTACVLFGVILLIGWLRASLLRHQTVAQDSTWGCGYARPSTRMQYTAASFAEPILIPFSAVLSLEIHHSGPEGHFPSSAYYESHRGDLAATRLLPPAFRRLIDFLFRLHSIQRGRVQLYLVYIFITLIVLLVWQLSTITLS
jgi:NADH:ubiquinone oxidoreductase subunit 5 (subunit L)/multisubunit Na+/H+ antiporter MnhA subunit